MISAMMLTLTKAQDMMLRHRARESGLPLDVIIALAATALRVV